MYLRPCWLEKAVWGLALMTGATFAGLNGASVIERRGMAVLVMDWLAPVVDEMHVCTARPLASQLQPPGSGIMACNLQKPLCEASCRTQTSSESCSVKTTTKTKTKAKTTWLLSVVPRNPVRVAGVLPPHTRCTCRLSPIHRRGLRTEPPCASESAMFNHYHGHAHLRQRRRLCAQPDARPDAGWKPLPLGPPSTSPSLSATSSARV
jgi:hypothetical protein